MPLYDYHCTAHGAFSQLAEIEAAVLPAPCPRCSQAAPRVIGPPRAILGLRSELMHAYAINERSRHEPLRGTAAERPAKLAPAIGHRRTKVLYTRDGDKMFPSMRPWMIGH